MTKKGVISSNIADFMAYLFLVLVIIFFYILFSMDSKVEPTQLEITGEMGRSEISLVLLNLLKTPAGSNANIADLIAQGIDAGDFESYKKHAQPILDEFFKSNFESCCWRLSVTRLGTAYSEISSKFCGGDESDEIVASVMIPSASRAQAIEVRLSIFRNVATAIEIMGVQQYSCSYKK